MTSPPTSASSDAALGRSANDVPQRRKAGLRRLFPGRRRAPARLGAAGAEAAPLIFLGDSHVLYFVHAAERGYFGERPFRVCSVNGATAVGLRNPNSKTQALEVFSRFLEELPREAILVIQLGEVDCGFVIWYRHQKYQDGLEHQVAQSIDAYFAFVDEAMRRGFQRIVITGATLPTIRDGRRWGKVANARREVTASLVERTRLTIDYNRRLAAAAAARGLPYIDIAAEVLSPRTGTVKRRYRRSNPLDHHMKKRRAAKRWAARLNRILAEAGY